MARITKQAEACDLCGQALVGKEFVDGATVYGPWANMCMGCYSSRGVGLGMGRGQRYDATGVKVEG